MIFFSESTVYSEGGKGWTRKQLDTPMGILDGRGRYARIRVYFSFNIQIERPKNG